MLSKTSAPALLIAVALSVSAAAQTPAIGVLVRPAPQTLPPTTPVPPTPPPSAGSRPLPRVVVRESDNPLQLGDQTYQFVVRTERIDGTSDEATEWWELRDPNGTVVYRRDYPIVLNADGFEETELVAAHAFSTKSGSGVLVEGLGLPSAPDTGSWVQLFGFKWGPTRSTALVAFGPPISIEGEFLDIATDPRRQPPSIPGRTVLTLNDILRFRLRTGNFNIIYPVLINWISGRVEPSWHCLRTTSRGQVDRCDYPLQDATPSPRERRTFVRMFAEPDEQFTPAHIVVEPESKVELLQAEVPISWSEDQNNIGFGAVEGDDIWLQLRIDGQEGWIHTQEDFLALGLPQAE